MARVALLPSDLSNQIAAGEVVERPASVVKELVENALDAGATRVRIDIDQGGVACIRVTDDGAGMDADDARLSLERHATSKIHHIDDLARIATFGFRGEALPSIASVSRLTMTTRARPAPEGTALTIDGGGAPRVRPAGCAEGTSVEVKELFFNVPARRKFLKSQPTEAAHVGEVVMLAALARPEVTFTLTRDGRPAREYLRVASRRERVVQAIVEDRLEICVAERGPMRLEAHLAPPERARAGAVALHLFVNGRPVKDRQLARAVAQSYGSVLEPGRYPIGVVYIDLPPESVDVNVHPQKAEVRFADARPLFDAITRELYGGLARAFSIPAVGSPSRPWHNPMRREPTSVELATSSADPDHETLRSLKGAKPATIPPESLMVTSAATPSVGGNPYSSEPSTMKSLAERIAQGEAIAAQEPTLFAEPGFYGRMKFLAQTRRMFLLCEGEDGLYVLDQHAAAERVTFDRLRRTFASRSIAAQRLLLPELVTLSPAEMATVEEFQAHITGLGLELRAVGATAVAVHAVPRLLARATPERLVRDLVAELGRDARRPFGDTMDLILATMACHGSVRAGDVVSSDEALALLRALDGIDFAGHCPHGRPVVTRWSYEELERRVGR